MVKDITKRTGQKVPFEPEKIKKAMEKAFIANNWDDDSALDGFLDVLTRRVVNKLNSAGNDTATVEGVQDIVEEVLMEAGEMAVAKSYIEYRYNRMLARKANTTDESILALLRNENKELAEENSNKNTVIASTQRDYIAGEVSRDLTRRILLPERISKAHDEGAIHFHDADYFIQPIFNCFSSKTKFVTKNGIVAFSELKDGQEVEVLDKDGHWRKATVHYYGKQKLYDVTLCSARSEQKVVCTKNHRWILSDGSVTTDLSVGDTLIALPESEDCNAVPTTDRDNEMFALGFIIGDGSDAKSGLQVRLCGKKAQYKDVFAKLGFSQNSIGNSEDLYFRTTTKLSKQEFLDSHAWRYLSSDDKKMLFLGLYAADGSTDRNFIATADERILTMVQEISAIAGYHISSISAIDHDTNFKAGAHLYNIHFRIKQNANNTWKVKSIVPHHPGTLEQDVWCVEEPVTHSFTLEGGIVTGNCCLINIGDMLDNGTVMNDKLIESPKSFQVACTVVTQIIACIASNQYGGQSVDLRHLGKYLRRSREKYLREANETFPELPENERVKIAEMQVKRELKSGVQTIQYQINTLMTTNGQSPFVTLFLNLQEGDPYLEENAQIVEEVLRQRLEGIKNEKGVYITPAFPKLVYVLDEHNCLKGGKYDYITKLAVKCSAKRMYPDYISAKKMRENYEGNVFSPMGCRSFLAPWKDENGEYKFEGRLTIR